MIQKSLYDVTVFESAMSTG